MARRRGDHRAQEVYTPADGRSWLHQYRPHLAEVDRMRSDLTLARIERSWTDWRGRVVEPLVREALGRLLPARRIPAAPAIGGYWTRSNDVEIDIVGADREPVARQLLFLGSVKWLETVKFDDHDLAALQRHRTGSPASRCRSSLCPAPEHPPRRRRLHPSRPDSGLVTRTPCPPPYASLRSQEDLPS
jgi:hypothetical protein